MLWGQEGVSCPRLSNLLMRMRAPGGPLPRHSQPISVYCLLCSRLCSCLCVVSASIRSVIKGSSQRSTALFAAAPPALVPVRGRSIHCLATTRRYDGCTTGLEPAVALSAARLCCARHSFGELMATRLGSNQPWPEWALESGSKPSSTACYRLRPRCLARKSPPRGMDHYA